ncbi:UNVERIFIED_CONTAM: hypothetical protein FKN15_044774 [Acipenser sinensis]
MSSQEQTWEKLDSEFDHYLVDMKPYVLKLPHKSERQRCALWIKKLCEPSGSGTGVMGRKNRNMYARLLLHMLRRGALEGPFTHRPEPGTLKTLPTYMSIYFDEPLSARPLDQSSERLPDWVTGELGSRDSKVDDSWRLTPREDGTLTSSPRPAHSYSHAVLLFNQQGVLRNCVYTAAISIYFDEPLSARPLDQSSERLPDWVTGELGSRDSKVDDSWRLTPREDGTLTSSPRPAHRSSIYFDEPLSARPLDQSSERLPDWVTGELGSRDSKVDNSWRLTPREDGTLTSSPRPAHRRRHTYSEKLASQARSNILTHRSDEKNHVAQQAIENPRYLRKNPIPLSPISLKTSLGKNSTCYDDQTPVHMHEKELSPDPNLRNGRTVQDAGCKLLPLPVEMKAQVLEARCHEEKLKLQQKHDADVQKILDRKNNEIEELKNLYRTKQKESEEAIRKLEKKGTRCESYETFLDVFSKLCFIELRPVLVKALVKTLLDQSVF